MFGTLLSTDIPDIIDEYSDMIDKQYVEPIIFIEFTIILLFVAVIRFFISYNYEISKTKKHKTEKDKKYIKLYIFGHSFIELIISYVICYTIIKLTHANPSSYILNMIIAPAVGFILAIIIDNKLIIPLQKSSGFESIFNSKKSEDKKSNDSGEINITINNGQPENNSDLPVLDNNQSDEYLDKDLADSEEFNETIIDTINNIKHEQLVQSKKIDENTIRLENAIECLNILKESEMINKKIELKKMIYSCLNQGYATPEQNDRITQFYHSYVSLDGNHEVESLYNNHYLKLPIHNNSAIPSSIEIERKNPNKRVYIYGEFDEEI